MGRFNCILCALIGALIALSMGTGCSKSGASMNDDGGIIKKLDTISYDFDSATIRSDAAQTLKRNAEWLSANSKGNLVVEGHCDERGTNEYNLALGERRAQAAKSYYVNIGVPGSRISTISYGEERPLNPASSESAWADNRRGESLVKK